MQSTPKQWTKWLPLAELWYNTTFHSSLQYSPFKGLYGVEPNSGILHVLRGAEHQDVTDILRERQLYYEMLKDQLARAQNLMKLYADKNRIERSFQVGDHVLLKLQPYAQSLVVNQPFPKLSFKYFSPYLIVEKIGSTAYQLQLPHDGLIHPIFHVSQLNSFTLDHSPIYSQLPNTPALDISEIVLDKILDRRLVRKGNVVVTQVLIQWSGLPEASVTWEDYYILQKRFPSSLA
jgi:hypothetical protein